MKIFRIAQGGSDIPDKMVRVRVTIYDDGRIERELIRGGKTKCNDMAGELMDELLNMKIDGFEGAIATTEAERRKDDGLKQAVKPNANIPNRQRATQQEEDFDPFNPTGLTPREERKMEGGFGV